MNETSSLEEWLYHLEHRLYPEVQLRLINVQAVARIIDVLQWSIPVITVAGTNGKGSTVAALSAIYQAAGYRVGQFTSPHVFKFNERICINQQPIADDTLCQLFSQIEIARTTTSLTYFEMSLLAALLYFKQADLDLVILEVGVGGRLDATNIIDADLAIITTIDLDHQEYLGADKEAIGREKSGILRANRPFIYADTTPPMSVLAHAQALKTETYCLGTHYHYRVDGDQIFIQQPFQTNLVLPVPKLHANAAVAAVITSLCLHAQLPVTATDWHNAMRTMAILGRQHWVKGTVSMLYDVAHNPQAAGFLAQCLRDKMPQGRVHAVFSALKDKDICGLIRPLSSIVDQWYPTCLEGKRATSREHLLDAFATTIGARPYCYEHPVQAGRAALSSAEPGDLILVYGSFMVVGPVMAALGE